MSAKPEPPAPSPDLDPLPTIAVGGSINRKDKCPLCGEGLIFRVDEHENVVGKFCGVFGCAAWLQETPEPRALRGESK